MFFCEFSKTFKKNIFKEHACITTFEKTLSHHGTTITWKWYTNPFWTFASLLNIPFVFRTDASIPAIVCNWSLISKFLFKFKFEASFPELKLRFFNQPFFFRNRSFIYNLRNQFTFEALFPTAYYGLISNLCSENRSFNCGKEVSIPGTTVWFRKQSFDSRNEVLLLRNKLRIWVVITS